MDLPIRILLEPGPDRVVSVDGAWNAPGLNLSHWPGNTTPTELKHDLSTGIALAFARLPDGRQAELAEGCVALANNHLDTDGVCSMFALRYPELALPRAEKLLEAAAAGDFFAFPSEPAFVVDAIVTGLRDPERSPWRERFAGLTDEARYELCTRETLERFAGILDGEADDLRGLWEPELAALQADLRDLAQCAKDELVHLDLVVWTAPPGTVSSRAGGAAVFDPGRHALFANGGDRVLVLGGIAGGVTYRFLLGTFSWFELVTIRALPRPDLGALAEELNALEGTPTTAEVAWRFQPVTGASPELWFGTPDFETFEEHAAPVLRPSALAPETVKAHLVDALRATWVFPEESAAYPRP
ncbi:MAG: hypothetical protein E2O39_05555 [Planctomycetota bacterium]|nr:MAG: hypothetical protein E2O39_05555 [Planctomycetota bacterium]